MATTKDDKNVGLIDGAVANDGCIGNRRVRTIIIASVIFAFFVFALAYLADREDFYRDALEEFNETYDDCVAANGDAACEAYINSGTDALEPIANAWVWIIAGAAISMVGCVCAVVLFFIPGCDDKLGVPRRVAGFVLLVGGPVYMIGWIWVVAAARGALDDVWDTYSDEKQEQITARSAAKLGEAFLAGGMVILLGVDALFQSYDKESFRLASNLGVILVVAGMCAPTYYLSFCSDDDVADGICEESPDGVEAIATGYVVLFWACAVYVALYIFTCCTCNCKDNCLVRVVLAVALVIGGVIAAIGYYALSGGLENAEGVDGDPAGKEVAYWIGYTILVGGMCIVWALDIALDDVKKKAQTDAGTYRKF